MNISTAFVGYVSDVVTTTTDTSSPFESANHQWAPCWENSTADCFDFWREVKFCCLAAIIPVGLVFNTIAFTVFVTSWMRDVVPGRYFMALAVADNLVLFGEFLLWLNTRTSKGSRLGIEFVDRFDVLCKLVHMLRYGARVWSSWITVAITIERCLTVTFPLKMAAHSNPRKATVITLIIGVVCFALCSFPIVTLEVGEYKGGLICKYRDIDLYDLCLFIIIFCLGELVLPSVVVFVLTVQIIRRLAAAQRERRKFTEGQFVNRTNLPKSREAQPTKALLAIAIMFVTIRLPYIITFFLNDIGKELVPMGTMAAYYIYIAYKIANVFAVFNYAFNFLLFCLTGSTFRGELRRCVLCQRRDKRPWFSDEVRSKSTSLERLGHMLKIRSRSLSLDLLRTRLTPTGSHSASVEHLAQSRLRVTPLYGISASVDRLDSIKRPAKNGDIFRPLPLDLVLKQRGIAKKIQDIPENMLYIDE